MKEGRGGTLWNVTSQAFLELGVISSTLNMLPKWLQLPLASWGSLHAVAVATSFPWGEKKSTWHLGTGYQGRGHWTLPIKKRIMGHLLQAKILNLGGGFYFLVCFHSYWKKLEYGPSCTHFSLIPQPVGLIAWILHAISGTREWTLLLFLLLRQSLTV